MASNTEQLNLLKKNPVTDSADTFNIQTMLNDNWDKLDDHAKAMVQFTLSKGKANGLATLGADGKVPGTQINVDLGPIQQSLDEHKAEDATDAHNAGNISVLDTAGLFASSDVEGALKESILKANSAFQSASDGKTAVANAVTAKGVAASPTDTFPTLATKIGQISTGKKFASGTFAQYNQISVLDLSFKPTFVRLVCDTTDGFRYVRNVRNGDYQNLNKMVVYGNNSAAYKAMDGGLMYLTVEGFYCNQTGFPSNPSSLTWEAWE